MFGSCGGAIRRLPNSFPLRMAVRRKRTSVTSVGRWPRVFPLPCPDQLALKRRNSHSPDLRHAFIMRRTYSFDLTSATKCRSTFRISLRTQRCSRARSAAFLFSRDLGLNMTSIAVDVCQFLANLLLKKHRSKYRCGFCKSHFGSARATPVCLFITKVADFKSYQDGPLLTKSRSCFFLLTIVNPTFILQLRDEHQLIRERYVAPQNGC